MKERLHQIYENILKRKDFHDLVISFLSGILIGSFALFVSVRGNILSQNSMSPYFELSAKTDGSAQTGYIISNSGGYVQDATVTLQSIIHVHIADYTGTDFYFTYQSMALNCANLKNGDIVIDFGESEFGLLNWNYQENNVIALLTDELRESGVTSTVRYMEHLTLQYMDTNRTIQEEHYLIGKNEDGSVFLSLIPALLDETIHSEIHESRILGTFESDDGTSVDVAYTGSYPGGRGQDLEKIYVSNIMDAVKAYLDDF